LPSAGEQEGEEAAEQEATADSVETEGDEE
jgi:hypothetical protein